MLDVRKPVMFRLETVCKRAGREGRGHGHAGAWSGQSGRRMVHGLSVHDGVSGFGSPLLLLFPFNTLRAS
jgi:hypothetical protein